MLRFGIVGCGGISQSHSDAFKILEEQGLAKLVAGADPDPAAREKRGKEWGVPIYDNLTEMLKRDDLDAVSVCSPSGLHCDHAIEIMKSGRHALSEKPLDTKLSKVDEAIAVSKSTGKTLGVIFQQRFNTGPQKVKRAIDQGFFGEIVQVHCETPWYRSQEYYDSGDWRGTWDLDCGVLGNQAPHMIDRLMWLGGDIEEVYASICQPGRERKIEAETNAVAIVKLKNGAIGTITGTTLSYDGLPQRVVICGTKGNAEFEGDTLVHFKTMEPFEEGLGNVDSPKESGKAQSVASDPLSGLGEYHLANIKDYVLAVSEGRQPSTTMEDGRRVVRVLNMIYEKAGVGPYAQ